jgi:hypothetical protein
MPHVPDASMATRVRKAAATLTADPEKKSRTFVAPLKDGYLSAQLRASEVQRYIPGTVLTIPVWTAPQFARKRFSA